MQKGYVFDSFSVNASLLLLILFYFLRKGCNFLFWPMYVLLLVGCACFRICSIFFLSCISSLWCVFEYKNKSISHGILIYEFFNSFELLLNCNRFQLFFMLITFLMCCYFCMVFVLHRNIFKRYLTNGIKLTTRFGRK